MSIPLEDQIAEYAREWVRRAAAVVKDKGTAAELTLRILYPQSDDDGTLYLCVEVEERNRVPDLEGRVPGMKF